MGKGAAIGHCGIRFVASISSMTRLTAPETLPRFSQRYTVIG